MPNNEEKRLGALYEIVAAEDATSQIDLPENMTVADLRDYIDDMIRSSQPRHQRKEGRTSHDLKDYSIPQNYFMVDSNVVSFHGTMGSIFLEEDEESPVSSEITNTNPVNEVEFTTREGLPISIPVSIRADDFGAQICFHIFNHGRKTLDELISDLRSINPKLMTILVAKLKRDQYLKSVIEDDGTPTYELFTVKEKEKPKLKGKRGEKALDDTEKMV